MYSEASAERRRVLVVDDNRSIHSDFRKILHREEDLEAFAEAEVALFGESSVKNALNFDLSNAYQGRDALPLVEASVAEGRPFDLAFVDMRMPPGWDGIETIERLWQIDPDLHVVICTAFSDHSWRGITERLGSNDQLLVLKKPFDNIEVLQLAAALTNKRQLLRERQEYTEKLESRVREQTEIIHRAHEETIHRLVEASMFRDEETGAHIRRVGLFSAALAEAIGWPIDEVERIRLAAPMHDVGKIGIPDEVLQKPGRLTNEERAIMNTHATIGADLLDMSESPVLRMAHDIAKYHHERWDGTGYPIGLSGTDIPQAARIVAIADVYDALSHDRIYRPAMPMEQVLTILDEGHGSHFDPDLLNKFFEILPTIEDIACRYPDGDQQPHSFIIPKEKAELCVNTRAECTGA